MVVIIIDFCQANKDLALPLCIELVKSKDQKGKEILDACFPKGFSRFSRKIAAGGYFKIKSTDFNAFMFLKDELNQKRGLWNMALKRFMNSYKHGNNHYVLAGPGDKGDDQLWKLT